MYIQGSTSVWVGVLFVCVCLCVYIYLFFFFLFVCLFVFVLFFFCGGTGVCGVGFFFCLFFVCCYFVCLFVFVSFVWYFTYNLNHSFLCPCLVHFENNFRTVLMIQMSVYIPYLSYYLCQTPCDVKFSGEEDIDETCENTCSPKTTKQNKKSKQTNKNLLHVVCICFVVVVFSSFSLVYIYLTSGPLCISCALHWLGYPG